MILRAGGKDIAKVWQDGSAIKISTVEDSLRPQIEKIISLVLKSIHEQDQYFEKTQQTSDSNVELIEKVGYSIEPGFSVCLEQPKVNGERVSVDCVDEKTGKRWNIGTGIVK